MEMGTQQTEWNRFKLELGRICPPSPFPPMSPQRRHLTSLWMSCLLHRGQRSGRSRMPCGADSKRLWRERPPLPAGQHCPISQMQVPNHCQVGYPSRWEARLTSAHKTTSGGTASACVLQTGDATLNTQRSEASWPSWMLGPLFWVDPLRAEPSEPSVSCAPEAEADATMYHLGIWVPPSAPTMEVIKAAVPVSRCPAVLCSACPRVPHSGGSSDGLPG
ncbi:uncharacterized protein LOC104876450 isoform X1 [Fukomys damarensis]|uniref:uncharacterized protein LOC104876450 isoform X1 n=1 Tax=Fukomys damarensis TaxID=885580 RepID=UPI00053FB95B|nr:uncharacterized protein LOC104876450 isoform X1 [Fukomys damarensis]XP_019066247.1 uncharacterized protein LOC104876450 isoform X1 [Fukomys damarensis]